MALSDEVKASVSLVQIAEETVTWDRTKTRAGVGDYWAPCPFHGEATPSLHVTEKAPPGRWHCFGCGRGGSVIDWIMERDGVDFQTAVKRLASQEGIASVRDESRAHRVELEAARRRAAAQSAEAARARRGVARAKAIWDEAEAGHPALEEYLEGRGVKLGAIGGVPDRLRYHPDLVARDPSGAVIWSGPAMVAGIGRDSFAGVHRTWIEGPRRARFADGRKVPKQMLGRTGGIFGLPVQLATRPAGTPMVAGEGIETTLAYLSRVDPMASAEAALSLGALAGRALPGEKPGLCSRSGKPLPGTIPDPDRPGWTPPATAGRIITLADPSTKSPDSARRHAKRIMAKLAGHEPGATLRVPLDHWDHDLDFSDLAERGQL